MICVDGNRVGEICGWGNKDGNKDEQYGLGKQHQELQIGGVDWEAPCGELHMGLG